jgi:hypothetical protein
LKEKLKKVKTMTSQVYKNIKQLSYKELIDALSNMKEKLYAAGTLPQHSDFMYYIALTQELDNRDIY